MAVAAVGAVVAAITGAASAACDVCEAVVSTRGGTFISCVFVVAILFNTGPTTCVGARVSPEALDVVEASEVRADKEVVEGAGTTDFLWTLVHRSP